ncbi:hypothetical protein [Mesobacillus sp.]|uniref:hypothetical protein n=1 Tax=Mesobacillus sp. TaxID=2675271 RepID=UPI0039EF904D
MKRRCSIVQNATNGTVGAIIKEDHWFHVVSKGRLDLRGIGASKVRQALKVILVNRALQD